MTDKKKLTEGWVKTQITGAWVDEAAIVTQFFPASIPSHKPRISFISTKSRMNDPRPPANFNDGAVFSFNNKWSAVNVFDDACRFQLRLGHLVEPEADLDRFYLILEKNDPYHHYRWRTMRPIKIKSVLDPGDENDDRRDFLEVL